MADMRGKRGITASQERVSWLGSRALWGFSMLITTLVVFVTTGQEYISETMRGDGDFDFVGSVRWPAIFWYSWAVLVPLVAVLTRRFPLTNPNGWQHLALHIGACLVFFTAHVSMQVLSMYIVPIYYDLHDGLRDAIDPRLART